MAAAAIGGLPSGLFGVPFMTHPPRSSRHPLRASGDREGESGLEPIAPSSIWILRTGLRRSGRGGIPLAPRKASVDRRGPGHRACCPGWKPPDAGGEHSISSGAGRASRRPPPGSRVLGKTRCPRRPAPQLARLKSHSHACAGARCLEVLPQWPDAADRHSAAHARGIRRTSTAAPGGTGPGLLCSPSVCRPKAWWQPWPLRGRPLYLTVDLGLVRPLPVLPGHRQHQNPAAFLGHFSGLVDESPPPPPGGRECGELSPLLARGKQRLLGGEMFATACCSCSVARSSNSKRPLARVAQASCRCWRFRSIA